MSEDITQRLTETSQNCLKAYEAWNKDEKHVANREALQDAIHELRKVASRLEISLAISEREQNAQKPIPIPSHRDSKKGGNTGHDRGDSFNDDEDNGGRGRRKKGSGGKKSQGGNN